MERVVEFLDSRAAERVRSLVREAQENLGGVKRVSERKEDSRMLKIPCHLERFCNMNKSQHSRC